MRAASYSVIREQPGESAAKITYLPVRKPVKHASSTGAESTQVELFLKFRFVIVIAVGILVRITKVKGLTKRKFTSLSHKLECGSLPQKLFGHMDHHLLFLR